jgi:hypothetical protein
VTETLSDDELLVLHDCDRETENACCPLEGIRGFTELEDSVSRMNAPSSHHPPVRQPIT